MTTSILHRTLQFTQSLACVFVLGASTFASAKGMSGGLGSGIAYAARHLSVFSNPAALIEGDSKASLYGGYGFDTENITSTLTTSSGMVGFGGGIIYPLNDGSDPAYIGAIGFGTGKFNLGFNASYVSGGDPDFDAGLIIDLTKVRLGVVVRSLSDIAAVDLGLGFVLSGPLRAELNWYQVWPLDSKIAVLNGSILYLANPLSFEIGYRIAMINSDFSNGTIHAALEFAVGNNIGLQGKYNAYHDSSEYLAGLRLKF
jgi:hypothetical protein